MFVRRGAQEHVKIVTLRGMPNPADVGQLRTYLLNSTDSTNPDILLRRNVEMVRHFNEARARAERELDRLQRTLLARQQELEELLVRHTQSKKSDLNLGAVWWISCILEYPIVWAMNMVYCPQNLEFEKQR